MAALSSYEYLPFEDTEEFDRHLTIALMARLPYLALTTDFASDSDDLMLPDRLNYWLALWSEANAGKPVGTHKSLNYETSNFIVAMVGMAKHALPLWADEQTIRNRRELLADYQAGVGPIEGKLAVLLRLGTTRRVNPVLTMADELLGTSSPPDIETAYATLMRQKVEWHEIQGAMQNISATPATPSSRIDFVTRLCCLFCERTNRQHAAAEFHYQAADLLDKRHEELSLKTAIWHYQQARRIGMANPLDEAAAKLNEGACRVALAEFGIASQENLQTAFEYYRDIQQEHGAIPKLVAWTKGAEAAALRVQAVLGKDSLASLRTAINLAVQAQAPFEPESEERKKGMVNEAVIRADMAELGVDAKPNFEKAIELTRKVLTRLEPLDPYQGHLRMNQATALVGLAELGVEPETNMLTALKLYSEAEKWLQDLPAALGRLRMNSGTLCSRLAEYGVDPATFAQKAIRFCQEARRTLAPANPDYAAASLAEGNALRILADNTPDPRPLLEQAMAVFSDARKKASPPPSLQAKLDGSEAIVRKLLADYGEAPAKNLKATVFLCEEARKGLSHGSPNWGRSNINEASARVALADMGFKREDNLRAALKLYREARPCFGTQSHALGLCLRDEATVLRKLVEIGAADEQTLREAIALCPLARDSFHPQSGDHAVTLMAEANLRHMLAESHPGEADNLQTAVALYQEARQPLAPEHPTAILCKANEGMALVTLAQLGQERESRLQAAVELFRQSAVLLPAGTPLWGRVQRMYARALHELGYLPEAHERIQASLAVLETTRSGLQSESERIAFFENVAAHYATAVNVCLELAAQADGGQQHREEWTWQAWHYVHRSKNRSLVELLAFGKPPAGTESHALLEERERQGTILRHLQQELLNRCNAVSSFGEQASKKDAEHWTLLRKLLEQAQQENDKLNQSEVAEPLGTVNVPSPREAVAALRQLAGCSPSGEVADGGHRSLLVEFFLLNLTDVVIFILPLWAESSPLVERLTLPSQTAEQWARAVLSLVEPSGSDSGSEDQLARLGEAMAVLVEPWGKRLESWQPTDLLLSSHYFLNLLPLHLAAWQQQPLIASYPVAYLPSPTLAPELLKRCKPLTPHAVLVGNPTNDLPDAARESDLVNKLLLKQGFTSVAFQGREATIERVCQEAKEAGILHLACHAILEPEFLGSGLALDRRLTVQDAMTKLKLPKASLSYLSSCNSALAVPGKTDELMALVRVFLFAGSPTVIACLWPVKDEAGLVFATHFYKGWGNQRRSLVQAFQTAMLETRKAYPNTDYWAPFVLIGAWQQTGAVSPT